MTLWLVSRAKRGALLTALQKIVAALAVMLWIGIIFAAA